MFLCSLQTGKKKRTLCYSSQKKSQNLSKKNVLNLQARPLPSVECLFYLSFSWQNKYSPISGSSVSQNSYTLLINKHLICKRGRTSWPPRAERKTIPAFVGCVKQANALVFLTKSFIFSHLFVLFHYQYNSTFSLPSSSQSFHHLVSSI